MTEPPALLVQRPPARSQFRSPRRARPTGCTVVHTAESALDLIGADTGAEGVSNFIRTRTTPGSYHDIVDSDSVVHLVRYGDEAFQDGTGSNPWALSLSFALRAADWPSLSPQRRDAFLRQGAEAFRRQQGWLASRGYPLTPLRRISKAQSNAGRAGFIAHGERDPGRRSDPGRDFPWGRFFEFCATPDNLPEEDMSETIGPGSAEAVVRLVQKCVKREAVLSNRAGPGQALVVDGDYGAQTTAAVEEYQRGRVKSAQPGIVGGVTSALLFRYENR